MAAHNHADYVVEALASAGRQSNRDFEVVVVDDGSTDATADRIASWMADFTRSHQNPVRLHRIRNSGQSAAMAHGFGDCRGRYICLLDSDDRWLENKLEEVQRAAEAAPDAGMIVHPMHVIDSLGRRTGQVRPLRARLSNGDCRDALRRTGRHVAPGTSGVVIRSDIFARLVPMPTSTFPFGADAYLTFGATLLAPVRALSEPLAEYRIHSSGQYLRRMVTEEGLTRTCEFQRTIAGHFGLEAVLQRNSYFMRNVFALGKLKGGYGSQLAAYRSLIGATAHDDSFRPEVRLLLNAFWSVCFLAPRPVFLRLWRRFQLMQTAYPRST
ncbi:MAG: glycosyltransferase family 2 protein [Gemmatimonadales bacterium]